MSSPAPPPKKKPDFIQRGKKFPSPLGSALFVGLRAVDTFIQYGILRGAGSGLLHKVGINTLPPGLPINTGIKLIDGLGLSPYRLILLAMATGSSVKQIYWLLAVSKETFPPALALGVAGYNSAVNTLVSLAFTTSLLSGSLSNGGRFPQPPLVVGSVLYVIGLLMETVPEVQRRNFKDDPRNEGKVCTQGLWGLARHVNYAGYLLWRTGHALAAGGWILGAGVFVFHLQNFIYRSIPELDGYCSERYGEQWVAYKKKTSYRLFPGIV